MNVLVLYIAGVFGTVELDDLLQVAEDVFDVGRWQYVVTGQLLVEDIVQDFQHAHVCALRVEQL